VEVHVPLEDKLTHVVLISLQVGEQMVELATSLLDVGLESDQMHREEGNEFRLSLLGLYWQEYSWYLPRKTRDFDGIEENGFHFGHNNIAEAFIEQLTHPVMLPRPITLLEHVTEERSSFIKADHMRQDRSCLLDDVLISLS
jgi:hypothetical protein